MSLASGEFWPRRSSHILCLLHWNLICLFLQSILHLAVELCHTPPWPIARVLASFRPSKPMSYKLDKYYKTSNETYLFANQSHIGCNAIQSNPHLKCIWNIKGNEFTHQKVIIQHNIMFSSYSIVIISAS